MMETARETLSHILLSKKEKCIQNCMRQSGKKDCAVDQSSVSDKNDLLLDRSFNKCCFCTKVFVSSKFLIQHVLRRHSENLVVMYRKLYELNVVDHLSQNDMINIITSEFSKLRKDLESIKSSFSGYQSNPNFYHDSPLKESNDQQIRENFASVAGKVDVLTTELQALRVTNEKIEKDISDLKVQWNECDIKSLSNSPDVKDTLIYQALKGDLLLDLQSLIAENNKKLKLNINQLSSNYKADIERLEDSIKTNLEKIDTSTLVQETLKSLEKEIEFFFSCHKAKKFKTHTSELNRPEDISPKVRKIKPSFNQKTINFGSSEKPLPVEKLNGLNIPTGTKILPFSEHKIKKLETHDSELNLTEKINRRVEEVEPDSSQRVVDIGTELEKKLNFLNIPPGTNRLSITDYTSKMNLVESEREALSKKYQSFSCVYQHLSSNLDNIVSQKLKAGKKSRKIRFSLTSKASRKKLKFKAEGGDAKLVGSLSDLQKQLTPRVLHKQLENRAESGDTKLVEKLSDLQTQRAPRKQLGNIAEGGDTKLVERLSDLQDGSSIEDISVKKTSSRNITPINMADTELMNRNISKSHSAASLRLISSSKKKRQLPSVPQQSEPMELSPYDSLESDF